MIMEQKFDKKGGGYKDKSLFFIPNKKLEQILKLKLFFFILTKILTAKESYKMLILFSKDDIFLIA